MQQAGLQAKASRLPQYPPLFPRAKTRSCLPVTAASASGVFSDFVVATVILNHNPQRQSLVEEEASQQKPAASNAKSEKNHDPSARSLQRYDGRFASGLLQFFPNCR